MECQLENPNWKSTMVKVWSKVGPTRGIKLQILIYLHFSANLFCVITRTEMENWAKFRWWKFISYN